MDAKEIAEEIINQYDDNYQPGDRRLVPLAKAYLDQETRIQGLVEALEIIANSDPLSEPYDLANFAQQTLTAYKEGK